MEGLNSTTIEIAGDIGIITLNPPPANIIHDPEFISLTDLIDLTSNQSVKGLIITGAGKNFSVGGDPEGMLNPTQNPGELEQKLTNGKQLLTIIERLEIPVIAAINRVCFGGGLEIALACHIRVASENALMAFPEVNQNLIPGLNGTVRLPSIIGKNQALLMIMAGDTINACDAKKIGLIDYIAPKDGALDFSQNLMNKMIKDRPLHVINAIMRALNNSDKLPPDLSGKEETRLFCELARTEIHRRKAEGDGSC